MEGSHRMAGEQRKCANCRYFQDAGVAKNGWCTHPKRQTTSDVMLLVRAGELACRNPWGGDLFESRRDDQQSQDGLSPDPDEPQPSAGDDEVTSVVTPPERFTTPLRNDEDRVVSDRPAPIRDRDDDDTYNDAARLDQDERARIMARGSRDAIMRARERHSSRRNPADPIDRDADIPTSHDRVVAHQSRFSDRDAGSSRRRLDDAPVPRSETRNRFGLPADRFDTVPDIDPSFELPGYSNTAQHPEDPEPTETEAELPDTTVLDGDSAEPAQAAETGEPYEHVLERARRIRQAKMQKAANPLRHSHLLARHLSRTPMESELELEPASPHHDPEHDAEPMSDAPEGMDEPLVGAPMATDASWSDALIDEAHEEEPEDTDIVLEADDPEDEWEASIEDAPAGRTGRRSGGWLSHFGIRRRAAAMHDDAQITRHTGSWDDDDAREDDPAPSYQLPRDRERMRVDPRADRRDDPLPEPRYARRFGDEAIDDEPEAGTTEYGLDHDVAYDNMASPSTTASGTLPDLFDGFEEPEPTVATTPVERPRTESWHRQRTAHTALPDLDDNLFEERFERGRAASPADALDRAPMSDPVPVPRAEVAASRTEQGATWPRESYFRSSRYRPTEAEPGTDVSRRLRVAIARRAAAPAGPGRRRLRPPRARHPRRRAPRHDHRHRPGSHARVPHLSQLPQRRRRCPWLVHERMGVHSSAHGE